MQPHLITQIADKLATELLPAEEIRRVLHALGFRVEAPELHNVLDLAAELQPIIELIRPELPGFWEVIDRFRQAPDLRLHAKAVLDPATEEGAYVRVSSRSKTRGRRRFLHLRGNIGRLLNAYDVRVDYANGTESRKILLCLLWLLTNIPIDSNDVTDGDWLLPVGHDIRYGAVFDIAAGTESVFQESASIPTNGLTDLGLFKWLEKMDEQYPPYLSLLYGTPSLFRQLASRLNAANDTANRDKFSTPPSAPKNQPDAAQFVSYIEFDERYLSRNHWYYPTPTEIDRIRWLFHQTERAANADHIESTILLIAFVTCRTVDEALQLDIAFETRNERPENAGLRFRLVPGYRGQKWRLAWIIPETRLSQDELIVSLPERLTDALRGCVEDGSRGRLIDLLPDTLVDWKTRIETVGQKVLGSTTDRLNQLLRDSVLRAVYGQSSNRALISMLGSHRLAFDKIGRAERLALSHYMDPRGKRTFSTYRDACAELLGAFGRTDTNQTNCNHEGEHKLPTARQIQIAEKFRADITLAKGTIDQVRECHNTFARYSLLLLLAATGHRRSKTPIYFPWDIRLEEKLLFISDKIVVGSEARFVPLADEALQQIRHYLGHLAKLRLQIGSQYPEVARHIDSLICIGGVGPRALVPTPAPIQMAGLFFTIDASGICQTLSTRQLDQELEARGFGRICRLFRPALADALWNSGHTGMEVTALLGHANDLHPFGPASNWSVVDWANRIRPSIQTYLERRGWQSIESPLAQIRQGTTLAFPSFDSGDQGYEGRFREKRLAMERARQAIRAVISDEILRDEEVVIDDAAVVHIRERVEQMLANDPKAMQQALGCLATQIKQLRAGGMRVSSTKTNWWHGDPSPVELTFSRHMEIAATCRNIWFNRLGYPIAGPLDEVERAAQIAISLVIAEGVLSPTKVIAATTAAMEECDCFPDLLSIRTDITANRSSFDFVHLAGTVVAAQILGWQRVKPKEPPPWKEIEKRIGLQLTKILGRKAKGAWKIKDLCLLFRPWWFVRLPGPIYAISVGNHNGPAPNETSDASLFGLNEPSPHSLPARKPAAPTSTTTRSALQEEAIKCLTKLRSKAAGNFEKGTQTNRSQRKRLRELLSTDLDPELAEHMHERPIVDALVGFLGYLHDQGGVRGRLRYNSINTYLGVISEKLILEGWDADFEIWEEENFLQFYETVIRKCDDYRALMLIRQFHQHLRDCLGAPYILIKGGKLSDVKSRCRSTLITRKATAKAYELISTDSGVADEWKRPTAALLSLSDGYGLRPKEALGISINWFDSRDGEHLLIRRNIIRDLKHKASRRVLPACLPATVMRPLKAQIKSAEIAPEPNRFLFGTPDRSEKLMDTRTVRRNLIYVLRAASGNGDAVIYDLRHTYATRLGLAALPAPANLPATYQARLRIGRLGDQELDEVRRITRTPSGNPFVIDAIGQLLGHASVNTLLNTYFHGAPLVHA
ncbi:MAG: hypothetical protein U1A72_24680, partial [Sulfuritalea sp.]|nr:hypothetical protein [Sulfuritalea sp.]